MARIQVTGLRTQDTGQRTKDKKMGWGPGFSAVADITVDEDKRHKKQDSGFRIQVTGFRTQDTGQRTQDKKMR